MEWSKAKSMLIALFLILNIVLAVSILSRTFSSGSNKEMMIDVLQIMNARGVSLQCEIPTEISESRLLICEDNNSFFEPVVSKIQSKNTTNPNYYDVEIVDSNGLNDFHCRFLNSITPITMETIEKTDLEVRLALLEEGIDLVNFVRDIDAWDEFGNLKIHYIMIYDDALIFDNEIIVLLSGDGRILEIIGNYREIKKFSDSEPMKVIPPYQILLKHYNESEQVIQRIELGFMDQSKESHFVESEEGAVWRIRLEDGTERFFEATYGEEISLEVSI